SEIQFAKKSDNSDDRSRLVITLSDPFPYGVTSVANPDSSGHTFRQDNVPMVDGNFRVDDSVPPVIISAVLQAASGPNKQVSVLVTYSEPVNLASPTIDP